MLSTRVPSDVMVRISDSTVIFSPTTARIGYALMPYSGGTVTFTSATDLVGAPGYQNTLLYLSKNPSVSLNMSRSSSAVVSTQVALTNPTMSDSTGYPMGLFTFYSADGTSIQLVDYRTL